jgi:hypothetical protein
MPAHFTHFFRGVLCPTLQGRVYGTPIIDAWSFGLLKYNSRASIVAQ